MIRALLAAAVVVLATDYAVQHAMCGVGCRRGGWTDGAYRPKERDCYCVEYIPFEEITGTRLVLPKRPSKPSAPEPAQPVVVNSSFPWSF